MRRSHDIHDTVTERKDLQPGPELDANVARERDAREVVGSFYTTFQALVRPYIHASKIVLVALDASPNSRGQMTAKGWSRKFEEPIIISPRPADHVANRAS